MRSEESRQKSSIATKRWYQEHIGLTDRSHGLSKTRTWKAWRNMRSRVRRPTDKSYERYKNYLIDVRWEKFLNFHADMGECPEGMTLDRKDNTQGYSKENCRWATWKQQARNRKGNKLLLEQVIEMKGEIGTIPGYLLARKYGVSQQTICDVKHGRIWTEVAHV